MLLAHSVSIGGKLGILLTFIITAVLSLFPWDSLVPFLLIHTVCGKFCFMNIVADGAPANRKAIRPTTAAYANVRIFVPTVHRVPLSSYDKETPCQ